MAKGSNPMDAYRKAQRKKELKKNKAERSKARDFALVKKDTRDLEDEIEKLESTPDPSAADKTRLAELKTELEKINQKKEEYVKEHPEQRKLVFRARRPAERRDEQNEQIAVPKTRNLFRKNGLPRHPERSLYYDPVYNPYGVPPPGMPYVERGKYRTRQRICDPEFLSIALLPNEVDSELEESDDDIVMPEGPPPEDADPEVSDEDIPMPEGPPPPKPGQQALSLPPLPGASPVMLAVPPTPQFPSIPSPSLPLAPPPPFGVPPPPFVVSPPPPLVVPPPPPGFTAMPRHEVPPLPPAGFPPFPPPHMQPPLPPPPPGFYPRRDHNAGPIQDPLSSVPHQTYQVHRAARAAGPPGPKATSGGVRLGPTPSPAVSAVISAGPELRDFKKEATAFVPAALKRKKVGGGSKVNAAPSVGPQDEKDEVDAVPAARPDLLSTLQDKFGAPPPKKAKMEVGSAKVARAKPKDDYDKFLEEMSDILVPSKPSTQ
ncbi:WW domain binding protein 11-domain-containing protein [Trametes meyenii]|nr:WW domain binding protein 11-domain-containing protein [Trametes meyenii]